MAVRPKTYQQALREAEKKRGGFSIKNMVSDFKMAIGAKPKSSLYKLQTRRGIDNLKQFRENIGKDIFGRPASDRSAPAPAPALAQTQQVAAAPAVTTPTPPAAPTADAAPGPAEAEVIKTAETATGRKKTIGTGAAGLLAGKDQGPLRKRRSLMGGMIT